MYKFARHSLCPPSILFYKFACWKGATPLDELASVQYLCLRIHKVLLQGVHAKTFVLVLLDNVFVQTHVF